MPTLDLNLLRVLGAMFEHETVSAAASALGVSQPNASMSLRRLRAHFGDELFVRHKGRMLPTALAQSLRTPVAAALSIVEDGISRAMPFDPATSDRTFAICLSDLGDLAFLPDLMAALKAAAPGIAIRSVTLEPAELLRALAEGAVDLAIGHLTDLDTNDCYEQTLFEQSFVCLVRREHPHIPGSLSMEQYLEADHAVVVQGGRSQELFERRVSELGLRRRIVLSSPHFMSLPFLVAHSDMVTVVPLAVARIYAKLLPLRVVQVPFEVPSVALRQLWHRRAHSDPAVAWLRRLVAGLYVGRDPTGSRDSPFWSTFLPSDGSFAAGS